MFLLTWQDHLYQIDQIYILVQGGGPQKGMEV